MMNHRKGSGFILIQKETVTANITDGLTRNGGNSKFPIRNYTIMKVRIVLLNIHITRETCLTNNKSEEIIIKSTETDGSNRFEKEPILFLASDKSDRLLIQYYIKVRQLSISKEEYDFWDKMNKINENGGDIFDKQPFEISSNIHNINKPTEQVLGYFQVSGATVKSLYITKNQIRELNIPVYKYNCTAIVIGPSDFPADHVLVYHPLHLMKFIECIAL